MRGQPLANQPCGDVDPAAGGKAGDDAHRPRRIILRRRELRKGWRGGNGGCEFKEFAAGEVYWGGPRGAPAFSILGGQRKGSASGGRGVTPPRGPWRPG